MAKRNGMSMERQLAAAGVIPGNPEARAAIATPRRSKQSQQQQEQGPITFVCPSPAEAQQVCLAGDFNAWDPQATPMEKRDGYFEARVALEPGEHEYKFVVDGQWVADPAASLRRPNPYGSENSVVRV